MELVKAPNLSLITKAHENKWVAISLDYQNLIAVAESLVSLRKKVLTRSRRLGCDLGGPEGRSSEGVGGAGGAGLTLACEGAGFTCPRNSTDGRRRTSRTSNIVSGAGSGGGSGELASKLSGGMRTVYTGSPAEADGGGAFSVLLRSGGNG